MFKRLDRRLSPLILMYGIGFYIMTVAHLYEIALEIPMNSSGIATRLMVLGFTICIVMTPPLLFVTRSSVYFLLIIFYLGVTAVFGVADWIPVPQKFHIFWIYPLGYGSLMYVIFRRGEEKLKVALPTAKAKFV